MTASDLHQRMLHLLDRVKAMEEPRASSMQSPSAPPEFTNHPAQSLATPPGPARPAPETPVTAQSYIPGFSTGDTPADDPLADDVSDEERGEARHKVLRRGKIIYAGGNFEVECQIRDLNTSGARLKLSGEVTVPSCFDLTILPENIIKKAQVCWKEELILGIKFIEVPQ